MLEEISSPIAKGKRVRSARMLAGLNRIDFQEKYGIHINTLKSWENPTGAQNGLTLKGAQRFVQELKQEGVFCTAEWLLTGNGIGPRLLSQIENSTEPTVTIPLIETNQDEAILKEAQFFVDTNPNSIIAMVTDDLMAPFYQIGDYVGGYKRLQPFLKNCVNIDCIVETGDNSLYICRFFPTEKEDYYRIIYLNEHYKASDNHEDRVHLINSASPIVWHRKRDQFL